MVNASHSLLMIEGHYGVLFGVLLLNLNLFSNPKNDEIQTLIKQKKVHIARKVTL